MHSPKKVHFIPRVLMALTLRCTDAAPHFNLHVDAGTTVEEMIRLLQLHRRLRDDIRDGAISLLRDNRGLPGRYSRQEDDGSIRYSIGISVRQAVAAA